MKIKASLLILFLTLIFLGCGDRFYAAYSREDLYRLPLIRPFELNNIFGADSSEKAFYTWQLDFKYNYSDSIFSHRNVTDINVCDSIIFGHGKTRNDAWPNNWFIIILPEKKEITFDSEVEWKTTLRKYNLNPDKLYSPWAIFLRFKDTKKLPWRKEQD